MAIQQRFDVGRQAEGLAAGRFGMRPVEIRVRKKPREKRRPRT